jgi:sugar/nucleoside kinase (ribokinase family)
LATFICGGLTTFDLAYFAEEPPVRGQKATARMSYTDVGGPVANAAVTAVMLGAEAEVHSVFGTGLFARRVVDLLYGYGATPVDHDPRVDLPVASVWIDGTGERTIVSTDNKRSEVEGRPDLIDLEGAAAVLLDGHYPQLQRVLAEAAVTAGVPIVLDCGRWRPLFSELLPVATDVIATSTFRPPDCADLNAEETAVELSRRFEVELCALTRGAENIVVCEDGAVTEIPVPRVDVVDTTGAGDVLHGSYLYYRYVEGQTAGKALRLAAEVASESCRYPGARTGVRAVVEAD